MKRVLLIIMLSLTVMVVRSQTIMVLNLPDPCSGHSVDEFVETSFGFSAFPNPADDKLTLQFSDAQPLGKMEVTLFDIKGSVMKKVMYYSSHERLQTEMNIQDLAPGIYFMEAKGNGNRLMKKIIKK